MQIVRLIILREHVVSYVLELIDTCRKSYLSSHVDEFRAYNIREGEVEDQWKEIG